MTGFASVVLVDPSLAHLDRAFTYAVPDGMTPSPGALVRVPFHGRRRPAVVVDLMVEPDVARTLPIADVLGPGLDPAAVDLARWVADRYLATLGEALAAIVPQRVVSEEQEPPAVPSLPPFEPDAAPPEIHAALRARAHRGVLWRPRSDVPRGASIAAAVASALDAGSGAIVLLPEVRARSEVAAAMRGAFGDAIAWLGSDRPARARYRDWLALRAGAKRIAVGGRGAVFAPVADLGLIVVDDEGHASYKEGRAPRFHARTVAAERARRAGAVLVLVGVPGSVEARAATVRGPYRLLAPARTEERRARPPVTVIARERGARLVPDRRTLAMVSRTLSEGARVALLVHRGESLAAIADRTARITGARRPVVLDARATAATVRAAGSADLVVATPVIAKDVALHGIGTLAIVEADAALSQTEFRAAEDAFSTWWRAARWAHGGRVAIETTDPAHAAIVALTRWDPDVLWRAESARRRETGYPPFAALARIDVPADRAGDAAAQLRDAGVEVLGPVEREGATVIVARAARREQLLDALRPVVRRWRDANEPMRVDVDPWEVFEPRWRS